MSSVTREALCRVDACPEPRNPDWHQCIVDGNPVIEHAHILARSRRPDLKRSKTNIVALCHVHHQLQSDNKWTFFEESMPWGGLHQWLTDEHGNVQWKRDIGASSDGSEGQVLAAQGTRTSEPSPDAGATTVVGAEPPAKDGEDGAEATSATSDTNEVLSSPSYNEQGRDSRDRAFSLDARAETPAPYRFLDNGIECESEITFEQAVEIAQKAASEGRGRQWKAGDSVNIIERFGERAAQYVDVDTFDYPEPTLSNFSNVAKAFPLDERRSLPWSYHQSVFKLPDRFKWLDKAIAGGWDRATLREKALGKKPKIARYSVAQLREKGKECPYSPLDVTIDLFLDWLEQDE